MKILAAVDFSEVTEPVLATLVQMSATFPASVWLVNVAPPDPDFVGYEAGPQVVRGQVAAEHHARHQELQQMADRLRADGVEVTALLLQGSTVATIISEAERLEADLLVVGSHGRGAVHNMLVGSVAEGVVRASKVPVLLVPSGR
jgi:nucleotide-binding universal stress UspA family protein